MIEPKISQEENDKLVLPITKEELKDALFQMHPDKAPGPDGFNPAFYQHFWELCGTDVYMWQLRIGWTEGTSHLH
jgi:carbamoylphosphate synthase small subunit